ncbi:YtrH family sporulation protein [Anaerosolibacter sp.]|jgi:hypothetical protein|uniref:YtrH family sporulation protein n=1 Tax=Anaerosolibacter sp. TaxID=1872527 RepID=UPI002632082D|nr:YtrH family sporulation protein [Anaerosolibacter sp.]MDF2546210.1 sporulation protein [Anaerosolibacter sp.]
MTVFVSDLIYNFLIAFGVILGASFFAGVGAIINNHPPFKTMMEIAASFKIWAVAMAIGGTFTSFEVIDQGIFKGEFRGVIKQIIYILVALIGANMACIFIRFVKDCAQLWLE